MPVWCRTTEIGATKEAGAVAEGEPAEAVQLSGKMPRSRIIYRLPFRRPCSQAFFAGPFRRADVNMIEPSAQLVVAGIEGFLGGSQPWLSDTWSDRGGLGVVYGC